MPQQELRDFEKYWQRSMKVEIDSVLTNRHAGGKSTIVDGHEGVDYLDLISWCKGNSVSVDQRTLDPFRKIFRNLIVKARNMITLVDQGKEVSKIKAAGLSRKDLQILYGMPQARGGRRIAPGTINKDWMKAEILFVNLLKFNHIKLYKNHNTHALEEQSRISEDISAGLHEENFQDEGDNSWLFKGICNFLASTTNQGGHIRLNLENGWETYIRDHWGAPPGIPGVLEGSLIKAFVESPTMPVELHLVYAETLARAMSGNDGSEWGANQSKIRRELADKAIHHPSGDRVNLDVFYRTFSKYNAAHMADSFLLRGVNDSTATRYTLEEIALSEPKQWDVIMEPEFIRWRELQRDRVRTTGEEDV
jgi:hypothetical protein